MSLKQEHKDWLENNDRHTVKQVMVKDSKIEKENHAIVTTKVTRYIGLCVGVLLTLTILYVNDNYISNSNENRHDFITYDINKTMIYDVFCNGRYCSHSSRSGYSFWYILLIIGFWLSWKYRAKLGNSISKIAKKIHDKT